MSTPYSDITRNGLWKNNAAFVQLLGLCPLMAVSNSMVNALGLSLATIIVLVGSNFTVSLIRNLVSSEIRIPVFVLIIAAYVTSVELVMQAFTFELYQTLGLFIALITTNCAIIARAEAFAAKHDPARAAYDGLMMGLGFGFALVLLGGLRELLGQGTLLADAHLLFGEVAHDWKITVIADYRGWLLAVLPPGAFIGFALLVAGKNAIDQYLEGRPAPTTVAAPSTTQ